MHERRNTLAREIGLIGENLNRGQQSLQGLYQSIESNLELAKHAEGRNWEDVTSKSHDDDGAPAVRVE